MRKHRFSTFSPTLGDLSNRIESLLSWCIAAQRSAVQKTCPRCEDPCCGRVQYLYDEKDVLYLEFSGQGEPPRKDRRRTPGCPYLGARGCTLRPQARPYACHRYVCAVLEAALRSEKAALPGDLQQAIRDIEALRAELFTRYLEILS
ncbi:MAG: hypothetical protein JRJ16_00770 [Deltaproteobacteria bacterium]|nr:hypothetical protein [Deltaproteobacteria bacterium]